MKRTNIILEDEQHKTLKLYAKEKGRTLGGLVRDAIDVVYKKKEPLEERRQVALNAYQEGLISIGKLAEVLGLDPLSIRNYLSEKGINIPSLDQKELTQDIENA